MMFTTREFLGDSLIKELEGAGFSPQSINAFAKNEYRQRKAAQEEEQRRLLYRADDMKLDGKIREALLSGDINEQEAKNAQKFEEFGSKKHGFALGAAKTVTGIANTVERVGDFINPFYEGKRDKDGNYIYQNGLEKSLRPKIKNVEKMRDDYEKATGETSWGSRLSEIGTELVGDPINFVGGVGLLSKGSKLAQFGKKTLYFAGTGAASGGVAALGEGKNDEETLKNIGAGAVGGALLGHVIDQGIQGISQLIAKRQASKMANEADAIDSAENSEFLNGGNSASKDVSSGNGSLEYPNTQSIAVTIVRGVLKNEPLSTREQVLKEILSGEEKSSVIKPEKYKSILTGINEYKSYQNRLKHFHDNPNEVKNADLVFNQMQDDFMKANSGDTKKYYDAAPLFGRELKIAQTMTAKEFAIKEVGLDEDTATNVLKEAMQGKEKSEFIDADSYNDIVKFKNFETQREYAKAYGEKIQTAQTSINNAREQSAIRYADTQKAIGEYQKQGMSASATRELINAKFKPSADEINYTRAYNDGADVDARLAGQGIFYALEKDIAAQAYTPEIYATRLKQMGFSDESVQAFTQAYASKDIDIAKEYVNEKVANAYESRVQREVADEINSENRISINKDGAYSGHPMLRPDEPSIGQGDLKGNLINETTKQEDLSSLRAKIEQENNIVPIKEFGTNYAEFYHDGKGAIDKLLTERDGQVAGAFYRKELGDITLPWGEVSQSGNKIKGYGLAKIIKKHGVEILNELPNVFKTGALIKQNDVHYRIESGNYVVGLSAEFKGKKHNFVLTAFERVGRETDTFTDPSFKVASDNLATNSNKNIISQKGNLINEEAKNSALSNGVSGIGDNASGAGGRQGGDEEILRQSGRNTSSASQTKQTAQSDEQMEQRSAFKTDGDTDATASSKQMVEKQGRDDNEIRGDGFVLGDSGKAKQYATQKFNIEKWVNDLSGVLSDEWVANLKSLALKHPEMFKSESDVFKVIREIKNEPTHFLKNTRDNVALIAKRLGGGKVGNIGVKKDNGQIIHANKTDERDLTRLLKRGKKGELTRTPALETSLNKEDGELLKLSDEGIIPQKEINAKTINANSHIASGLVGGTLNSIDEDGSFNPEKFAAGFIAGLAGSKAVAIAVRKMTPQLYNKILGTAKKMPQMAKDNPKLLGKLYANGKDVSLNSFAGEKAITANVGKLDQAKSMLEKGEDEVKIWQSTGWYKDKDGAWKFEIDDSPAKIKNQNADKLGDLLEHKELFKAYPELKDIKIKKISDEKGEKLGYYDPNKKEIGINNIGDKSTLMHEVQHAIQEIEDFARGSGEKGEIYRLSHGEAEARNVQNRLNLGDKFRVKIVKDNNPAIDDNHMFDYHTWIRDESDIKTFKQAYNDDGGGDLTPDFTEAMAKKAIDSGEITVYSSKPIKAGNFVTPSKMEAKSYAGSGKIYEEKLNLNDISWIDALQGQVTRNKDIHPHETFDVNPDETIISKDSMINLSHELEKKYILKDGSINEAAVRKEAEPFIEKEYSLENFKAEFPNGKVDTPIGEVDVSVSQFYKLGHKGRDEYFGLIKPTLERPAFVVDFEDATFFFKPFRDKDGVVKFASVIKERDGGLDVVSNYPMKNRKFELITREGKVRYVQGSVVVRPLEHSLDNNVRSSGDIKSLEHSLDGKGIIQQNEEKVYHSRKIEEIKQEHPNVEKELDESIAAMRKESFNDVNFKDDLISKINAKDITTKQLGKSVDLSDKQLAVLKNDIKNADFKVISDSKIYFDKIGRNGDKKRFFIDIAEDGKVRVDGYSKKGIDTIPVRQSALEELAGVGDRARLKNMSFEVKAAYFNELDPIKKEAILKTAELNKLKKAAQSGDKMAVAKFEEFKARNLDENGNIKDGLSLC
ncbi:LPD23 domain-containing protein [Campylobacter concisus]|nr:LPD23 domain-containing protein [Campylobacter concisus]